MFSLFPIAAGTVSHLFVFVLKELSQITGTENILSEFSPVTITLLSLRLQGGFSGPPGYCTDMTNPAVISHREICHCRPVTLVSSHRWNCRTLNGSHPSSLELPDPPGRVINRQPMVRTGPVRALNHFFAQERIRERPQAND